jgi:hypothetical protein
MSKLRIRTRSEVTYTPTVSIRALRTIMSPAPTNATTRHTVLLLLLALCAKAPRIISQIAPIRPHAPPKRTEPVVRNVCPVPGTGESVESIDARTLLFPSKHVAIYRWLLSRCSAGRPPGPYT